MGIYDFFKDQGSAIAALVALSISVWQGFQLRASLKIANRSAAASEKAAEATRDSVLVQRSNLVAASPPKLVLKNIASRQGKSDSSTIVFEYTILNRGATSAAVYFQYAELAIIDPSFGQPPRQIPEDRSSAECLISAGGWVKSVAGTIPQASTSATMVQVVEGRLKLEIRGCFRYKDENGALHEMAFVRTFDPKQGRFLPLEDDDYEYSY
jgi:hypothetical protein